MNELTESQKADLCMEEIRTALEKYNFKISGDYNGAVVLKEWDTEEEYYL